MPLGRIIRAHGLNYHCFAGDSQLHMFVRPNQAKPHFVIGGLKQCCEDMHTLGRSNFLKLNDGKTEVLLVGSRQQLKKLLLTGVMVGDSLVAAVTSARVHRATFDTYRTIWSPTWLLCVSRCGTTSTTLARLEASWTETLVTASSTPLWHCGRTSTSSAHCTCRRHSQESCRRCKRRDLVDHSRVHEGPHHSYPERPSLVATAVENSIHSAPPSLQSPAWTCFHFCLGASTVIAPIRSLRSATDSAVSM